MPHRERMLGKARQAICGKCCGYHTKPQATLYKRAEKRSVRNKLRAELKKGTFA